MKDSLSRRNFIKGMTASAVAALGTGGLIGCADQSGDAPEGTDSTGSAATDSAPVAANGATVDMKHIIQLGIVVPSMDEAVKNFCRLFAVSDDEVTIIEAGEDVLTDTKYYGKDVKFTNRMALINYHGMQFEFIESTGGDDNPYSDYLKRNGPGIHHILVMFSDYDKSLAAIEDFGGKVMTQGKVYGGSYIYLDLLDQMGLVLETAESIDEDFCQTILQS